MSEELWPNPEGFDEMDRITQLEYILEHCNAYTIDGMLVDISSANVYLIIWRAMSQEAKEKMNKMPLADAVSLCWTCVR